ncbi:zinc finger protein 729-like [Scyliorhinus canicula]|uniref:zinc finger protein 729-like n=1 Tax=Scyliorhinus canicula TaxID=7830 RepID=UPI0018F4AF97|nr:zinc finger protein 729-like [Scyliorhinus canicula]XP_038674838.1 zinc finger protein 729-like [Scyliorhinus canicula]XP_038674839.1 zinc finger protein 729-like [Scyliorhinus canicula]
MNYVGRILKNLRNRKNTQVLSRKNSKSYQLWLNHFRNKNTMALQITVIHQKEFTEQNEECVAGFNTKEKLETNSQLNNTSGCLICVHCDFKYTDHETLETHLGSIHPEFSDLTSIVIYQKSAKLFHCQLCFFTNKVYSNVYNHVTAQHPKLDKNEDPFQIKEPLAVVTNKTSKPPRATKRKLKEPKVIKEEKPIKKRRGRKKRTEIASGTIEIQPVKPAETNSSATDVQPVKRRPGRPKRKVEETKSVDFKCQKCGTRFNTVDELNIHNCPKKKQKDANTAPFNYSDHYPVQHESTRKSTASSNPKEAAASISLEKLTAPNNPADNNHKKETVSNDPEESSQEKDYAKSLQENVKYVRGTFYCSFCRFHCKSKSSALYHIVRVHDKPYPYQCSECGRCFVMDKELQRHMSVHTGEAYYKCSKCDFESDYARAFKNHDKQCTAQQREDNCSENIIADKQQNADQERKLVDSELPSVQPHSSHKEKEQLHENSFPKIASAEAGKKYLKLNVGKIQVTKFQLLEPTECVEAHQQDSTSSKDNILSCHECGKTFEEQDLYQKHRLLHSVQKPLTCEPTHENVANLSDDIEKNHAEQKTFDCDSCNVKYQSKEDLQHHLNIHKPNIEGKMFNCEICSKKFERQIDLRDHLKVHKQNISKTNQSNMTDNRMLYKCNYCSYSTYLFVNYIGHVRIAHTKNFPIHCSFCGDGFQLPAELKKHTCQQSQGGKVISNQGDE